MKMRIITMILDFLFWPCFVTCVNSNIMTIEIIICSRFFGYNGQIFRFSIILMIFAIIEMNRHLWNIRQHSFQDD